MKVKVIRLRTFGNITHSWIDWWALDDNEEFDSCGDLRPPGFWALYTGEIPDDWTIPDGSPKFDGVMLIEDEWGEFDAFATKGEAENALKKYKK